MQFRGSFWAVLLILSAALTLALFRHLSPPSAPTPQPSSSVDNTPIRSTLLAPQREYQRSRLTLPSNAPELALGTSELPEGLPSLIAEMRLADHEFVLSDSETKAYLAWLDQLELDGAALLIAQANERSPRAIALLRLVYADQGDVDAYLQWSRHYLALLQVKNQSYIAGAIASSLAEHQHWAEALKWQLYAEKRGALSWNRHMRNAELLDTAASVIASFNQAPPLDALRQQSALEDAVRLEQSIELLGVTEYEGIKAASLIELFYAADLEQLR